MKMMTKLLLAAGGLYAAKRYGVTDMLKARGVPVPDFLLSGPASSPTGQTILPSGPPGITSDGTIVQPVTVTPPTQPNDAQDGTVPVTPPHYTSVPVKTTVIAPRAGLVSSLVRFVTAPATPTGGKTGGGVPTGPVIRRF